MSDVADGSSSVRGISYGLDGSMYRTITERLIWIIVIVGNAIIDINALPSGKLT